MAVAAAFSSTSGFAQSAESATALQQVVVTATRVAQPLSELVADVTVIDRAQIERSGAVGIADLLTRLPGFELSRNGGMGATTSLYIRGAETRFTAVYIDGVRVDSQSTGGATWDAISLSQVDRIEVLRGPAGAVYGSDALGGAIQIFTRKGEGAPAPFVAFGFGTYGTTKLESGVSASEGPLDYAVSLSRDVSTGFNAKPAGNPDDDGYRSEAASARLGFRVNEAHRIEASLFTNNQSGQYDYSRTLDDLTFKRLQTAALNWQANWSPAYSTKVSVGNSQDRYETSPSVYLTNTTLNSYLWQNVYRQEAHLLTASLERRDDSLTNASTLPTDTNHFQNALALGYGWNHGGHTIQLNTRHDEDSVFGPQNTGTLGYAVAFAPQWRATASAGTAYRAPTLFQRFSSYGSADLAPETSRNLELGLAFKAGVNSWNAVVYQNDVTNLISFSSVAAVCPGKPDGCYANTAKARYQGLTLSAKREYAGYSVHGSLDLQDPRDATSGKLLVRRTTHHGVLGLDTTVDEWSLGVELQASAMRFDDKANATVLPGYVLLNLNGQRQIAKDWTLLLRLDNATDTVYQLANGYATAGRTLYAGMRWAP